MKRIVQVLKTDWLYLAGDSKRAMKSKCDESKLRLVSLPHTNVELPYHHFDDREFAFVSWYRRHFKLPADVAGRAGGAGGAGGRRVFLDFDGVMIAATVFINGRQVAPEHKGGYVPFSLDITDFVNARGDNVLAVRVDSAKRTDIPPHGKLIDYLTFGGIYRDVRLRVCDPIFIEHIIARPVDVMSDRQGLDVIARVVNTTTESKTLKLFAKLIDAHGKVVRESRDTITVMPHSTVDDDGLRMRALRIQRWDLDTPNLYTLLAQIEDEDSLSTRIGFRTADFRDDGGFYLNDRPLKLRGLNRHQTYPYIGAAAPARLQRRDADILKHDLACNIVRTSHYPQSPHFLDRCDDIGLLVFEEVPGWQHVGDAAWQGLILRDLEQMIVRDRNHPSIILWGVRVNESADHHDFYTATNALAHRLDPTRQTGGVRYRYDSEFLEDVFTMNDFGYDLRPPNHPRYFVTEFCGHLYPTKSFDQEERVRQHAIHHAHVHNQIGGERIAGGIGWCAFDYNTSLDFGSGDRICYHGVMDIFRQPKIAAGFYAAHADPAKRIVLEPATYWKMGDKAGGGVEPLVIFSNCDEIEIFVGSKSRGRWTPDRQNYPHLARPPFVATGLSAGWGMDWEPLELRGYIAGKHVITRRISHDGQPARLEMSADDRQIIADGSDMTRVALRIVDEFDNILPFAMQPVMLKLSGPGVLVGDNPFPMPGGRGAVYVRSTRKPGTIAVVAETARLKPRRIAIRSARE